MQDTTWRRHVLASLGMTGAAAVAGCLGSEGDDENSDDENGEEEGPDDDIENYDPVSVAIQYYESMNDGDENQLVELSHSEGVSIEQASHDAEHRADTISVTEDRNEVVMEDLDFFFQPSAVVDLSFDYTGGDGDDLPMSDYIVMAVENEELLVYDTNQDDDDEVLTGEPDGPCLPEDDDEAMENLPLTSESFYQVIRDSSFDSADAFYHGPDHNWFHVEIEVHDSVEEAEEISTVGDVTLGVTDVSWEADESLVARDENVTCRILSEESDAAEHMDTLLEQTNCFNDDHIVERTDQ